MDASTISITDGTTTYSLVIWHPFELRTFTLISHPDGQFHAGDRVIARTNVVEDGPLIPGPYGAAPLARIQFDKAPYFFYPDVTISDHDLSFSIPVEMPPGSFELWLVSEPTFRIDRCDFPGGCRTKGRADLRSTFSVIP